MMLVLDASVALKWFFRERADEPDTDAALHILRGYVRGVHRLLAPPHFTAEVGAVLARETPDRMAGCLHDLLELAIPTDTATQVYQRALQLSHDLNHHLFDTLYHAVALENVGAVLVTADDRYWRKARRVGSITRLAQWSGESAG